jgi:hypothetical protein
MNQQQQQAQPPTPLARDTHAKALAINLDASIFGSFAEIGAGQEVARWFLTVGAAAGTVAQTISAYDKTFSDDTYGAGTRYVSRERLAAMLDREFRLLVDRLGPTRAAQSRFFAFADTIATRNYKGDNEQHGWIGLRFQTEPLGRSSDLLLHVNLMDPTASQQQQALGILGVNLLHAAHHARASAASFLERLWDGLSAERMEIDVLDFTGPAFAGHDPRAWCVQLLRRGMAHGVLFDTSFRVVEPSGILRKRPLLIDRGRFGTIEPFHAAMLRAADRKLRQESASLGRDPQGLLEMALHPAFDDDAPDDAAVLSRVKNMTRVLPALVSDLPEAFRLVPYLRRHTAEPIRLVGGVTLLARIMQSEFYQALQGRLLEGMGKLFASNVILYAYPMPRDAVEKALAAGSAGEQCHVSLRDTGSPLITADDLVLKPPVDHLYRYLRESGHVMPIEVE